MREQLIEAVKHRFVAESRTALVIGDLMLDRYLIGDVERISPEAPVPVVLLQQENERAGGAANVAANLSLLGIRTTMAGIIGNDAEGHSLLEMLQELGIGSAIITSQQRPTVTKTRILGGHQQMMRLDKESRLAFTETEASALLKQISQAIARKPDVIILSDYAKGVLSEALCQAVIAQARSLDIPVLVDPKGRDYTKYHGATALTPNKKETSEACGIDASNSDQLLQEAAKLRDRLGLAFLAITRGEEGISLLEKNETIHIPATAKQVFDVSGAGDTVIATLAAALVHGLSHHQAFELANIAAGIVVGKVGTVPVNRDELLAKLISQDSAEQADKICELDTLLVRVNQWKQQRKRIVFTNGCFDLLHAGHVTYLEAARKTGDKLILGLNTDRSVSALKGPSRPVIHEADRARVLAALEAVDAIILFDEDTPLKLIDAIRPDIIVKGSDYSEEQVVGGKEVKSWGGKVALIDIVPGRSTSNIIEKLGA